MFEPGNCHRPLSVGRFNNGVTVQATLSEASYVTGSLSCRLAHHCLKVAEGWSTWNPSSSIVVHRVVKCKKYKSCTNHGILYEKDIINILFTIELIIHNDNNNK